MHTTGIDDGSKRFATVYARSACSDQAFCCNKLSCIAVYLKSETNSLFCCLVDCIAWSKYELAKSDNSFHALRQW